MPTVGVMVTTTGYQRGAQDVAETYGIVILELREPSKTDTTNRIWAIDIELRPRLPRVVDFKIEAVELLSEQPELSALGSELMIEDDAGGQRPALELLLADELSDTKGPPTSFHPVVRRLDPPRVMFAHGEPLARVRAIAATVGEIDGDPFEFRVGGLEKVGWMLKNTLSRAHVWFAHDGRIWSTSE